MGFLAAMKGRSKLGKMQAAGAAQTAQEADAALAAAGRNVNSRVGALNAYYERGGGETPFTYKAGQRPYPWEANPAAGSATDLYQRGLGATVSPFVATAGGGALEWGASHSLGGEPWRQELADAQKAVEDKPTEANIQRLERARACLAGFETLQNMGRGAVIGSIPAEIKRMQRSNALAQISAWLRASVVRLTG